LFQKKIKMPFIDPTRILNNLVVLAILLFIFIMIYSKIDKEKLKEIKEAIKGMFGSMGGKENG